MKKLPKKCLTCAYMDFEDDEMEELRCTNSKSELYALQISDDSYCDRYEPNQEIIADAKIGMW